MTALRPELRAEEAPQSAPSPPAGERQLSVGDWIGFMSMVVGMFMAILDIQIVASSLAEIQAGISASQDEISWVQTSYLIAEVIMIPLSGWLARLLSTRRLFLASAITFTLMSVACAFAWDTSSMIVFRALQGFLGGAMIPTVFSTSFILFPPRRRPMISVLIGLTATLAPTIGPTLGGWLTQVMSWHWLFLINVLPGMVVASLVFVFVHVDKPRPEMLKRLDLAGILFVALFLGCLEYVLEEGPTNDWFEDSTIRTVALCSAVGFVLMLFRELTAESPVVDLHAFKHRNFLFGCIFSFVIGTGLYGSVYVVPLFLGRVKQYDSFEIGITMMVTGMFQFLSAPLAGGLSKKMDLRVMLAMGFSFFGLGLYLNAGLTSDWGYWDMFLPQAIRGVSLMFCFVPVNQLALGMLPPHEVQNASGLYNLMRNLGGAIGLATINTVINDRMKLHQLRLAEMLTDARSVVSQQMEALTQRLDPNFGVTAGKGALKLVAMRLQTQAMVLTFGDVLLLMSLTFAAALFLMPFLRKVGTAGGDDGAAH